MAADLAGRDLSRTRHSMAQTNPFFLFFSLILFIVITNASVHPSHLRKTHCGSLT